MTNRNSSKIKEINKVVEDIIAQKVIRERRNNEVLAERFKQETKGKSIVVETRNLF